VVSIGIPSCLKTLITIITIIPKYCKKNQFETSRSYSTQQKDTFLNENGKTLEVYKKYSWNLKCKMKGTAVSFVTSAEL